MSSVACGAPLSLAHLPPAQVIRLVGLSDEQLAVGLDPLPDGAPVVIRCRLPSSSRSPRDVVTHLLDQLTSVAIGLFPAWLPTSQAITTDGDFDLRVVRELAHEYAAGNSHFGPFLAEMAEAALSVQSPDRQMPLEVRARGLVRIIGDSYRREGVVLLPRPSGAPTTEATQPRVAASFEWLAAHGGFGIWLTAEVVPLVDRYPTYRLPVPAYVDGLSPPADPLPVIDFPALMGRPHPASVAEQTLERGLARCPWAAGRAWNQEYASHSLAPPIRVDLMWPAERCVVEIDGHDHRGILKYAADRRRDNGLTLDGFAVLRFTNEEIVDDPQRVLAIIESLLGTKRHDEGNLL